VARHHRRRLAFRALMLGSLAPAAMLGGCSRDIRCSDQRVIDALHRSLDQLYAEFRQVADVEWEIRDHLLCRSDREGRRGRNRADAEPPKAIRRMRVTLPTCHVDESIALMRSGA